MVEYDQRSNFFSPDPKFDPLRFSFLRLRQHYVHYLDQSRSWLVWRCSLRLKADLPFLCPFGHPHPDTSSRVWGKEFSWVRPKGDCRTLLGTISGVRVCAVVLEVKLTTMTDSSHMSF